jgi:hypothetical protein
MGGMKRENRQELPSTGPRLVYDVFEVIGVVEGANCRGETMHETRKKDESVRKRNALDIENLLVFVIRSHPLSAICF